MVAFGSQSTRRSVIAGNWYPGTEKSLTRAVDEYLAQVDQPLVTGELLGLISPHAGYAYSGQTAAYAYHQLQGRQVDSVVLLGPSHRAWVGDYAVSEEDAYETPLGRVPLDQAFIADLEQRAPLQRIDFYSRGIDVSCITTRSRGRFPSPRGWRRPGITAWWAACSVSASVLRTRRSWGGWARKRSSPRRRRQPS